jgi:glutamate-1-semialdehyde 2,1-aminomutase
MEMVAPSGLVYQAGTLAGNPVAMSAGIETLSILQKDGAYDELERKTFILKKGILAAAEKAGIEIQMPQLSSMFTIFLAKDPVVDYESALKADTGRYARFFHGMLSQGIYLPPSQFETAFVSAAHSDKDIQATVEAAERAFASLS